MKCRVIQDKPEEFDAQVKDGWFWMSIRSYASYNKHMESDKFSYYYSSEEDAKSALTDFAKELREAKNRKRKIILEGTVDEVEFLENL